MKNKSPLEKHRTHEIYVNDIPVQTKKQNLTHNGKLMCKKCNVMIKWATHEEIDLFNQVYKNKSVTYQEFVNQLHQPIYEKDDRLEYIYLVASYQDRNEVKRLGARFDWTHNLWYVPSSTPHLQKLKPWIHESDQIKLGLKIPESPKVYPNTEGGKLQQLLASLKKT